MSKSNKLLPLDASRLRQGVGETVRTAGQSVLPLARLGLRMVRGDWWRQTTRREPFEPQVVMRNPVAQGPDVGTGPLFGRRYYVEIVGAQISAMELFGSFLSDVNRFCPRFAPFEDAGRAVRLVEGGELEVQLPGPWSGPVSVVSTAETECRLETLNGHMEAGWVHFSASGEGNRLWFTIQSLARSSDLAFDVLYRWARIARLVQTEMWVEVLEAAVAVSGGKRCGPLCVETVVYGGDS